MSSPTKNTAAAALVDLLVALRCRQLEQGGIRVSVLQLQQTREQQWVVGVVRLAATNGRMAANLFLRFWVS